MEKLGYTYMMASRGKRLYTGVTSQLMIRVSQHKRKVHPNSFTARYNIDQLVYFEVFDSISDAINREATIKNLGRLEKIRLIVSVNSEWRDLSAALGKAGAVFDETLMRAPVTFEGVNTEIPAAPE